MHARAALCTLSLLRASAARSQPRNQSGRRAMHNSASIRDLKWHTQSPRRPHPHAQARALSRRGELSSVHVCVRARGHMDTRVRTYARRGGKATHKQLSPSQITQIKQGFAAIVQEHRVVGMDSKTGRKIMSSALKLLRKVGLIAQLSAQ